MRIVPIINTIVDVSMKRNPTWAGLFWKSQDWGSLVGPWWKKHAVSQRTFVDFTWILYIYCIDNTEQVFIKKLTISPLLSTDDVIMKVMCWRFLSFLGIDVFLFVTNGIYGI